MNIIEITVKRHNATKVCSCPVCNIDRMCDRMADLTEKTNRLVAALSSK